MRQLLRQRQAPAVVALHHALMAEVHHVEQDLRISDGSALTMDPLFTALPEGWDTHVLRSLVAHDLTVAMNQGLTWHVAAWANHRQVHSLFLKYLQAHWAPTDADAFEGRPPQHLSIG